MKNNQELINSIICNHLHSHGVGYFIQNSEMMWLNEIIAGVEYWQETVESEAQFIIPAKPISADMDIFDEGFTKPRYFKRIGVYTGNKQSFVE